MGLELFVPGGLGGTLGVLLRWTWPERVWIKAGTGIMVWLVIVMFPLVLSVLAAGRMDGPLVDIGAGAALTGALLLPALLILRAAQARTEHES